MLKYIIIACVLFITYRTRTCVTLKRFFFVFVLLRLRSFDYQVRFFHLLIAAHRARYILKDLKQKKKTFLPLQHARARNILRYTDNTSRVSARGAFGMHERASGTIAVLCVVIYKLYNGGGGGLRSTPARRVQHAARRRFIGSLATI